MTQHFSMKVVAKVLDIHTEAVSDHVCRINELCRAFPTSQYCFVFVFVFVLFVKKKKKK